MIMIIAMNRKQWADAWRWARSRKDPLRPCETMSQLLASNMLCRRDQPTPARVQVLPF